MPNPFVTANVSATQGIRAMVEKKANDVARYPTFWLEKVFKVIRKTFIWRVVRAFLFPNSSGLMTQISDFRKSLSCLIFSFLPISICEVMQISPKDIPLLLHIRQILFRKSSFPHTAIRMRNGGILHGR